MHRNTSFWWFISCGTGKSTGPIRFSIPIMKYCHKPSATCQFSGRHRSSIVWWGVTCCNKLKIATKRSPKTIMPFVRSRPWQRFARCRNSNGRECACVLEILGCKSMATGHRHWFHTRTCSTIIGLERRNGPLTKTDRPSPLQREFHFVKSRRKIKLSILFIIAHSCYVRYTTVLTFVNMFVSIH